jgi:hypothetical protein
VTWFGCIEDARKDLMCSRHRLSKFLLRRGHRFPSKAWTQPHERWLGKLSFEDAVSHATFVDYLCAVQTLVQRRRVLIDALEQAVPASSHAETVARLRCFRGIDTLTAAGLCAEVGDFTRFAKPALLSGFLGVVPSEYTSDDERTQGQITKAGPPHARRLLVEAAHHYRHQPAVREGLAARQAEQNPESCRSRGAASVVCTSAGRISRARAASALGRSRSRVHASSPRSAGRPRPWTDTNAHSKAPGGCRGTTSNEQGRHVADQRAREHRAMSNPRVSPAGWRPLLDREPGDKQGS